MDWAAVTDTLQAGITRWEEGWGPFEPHPALDVDPPALASALAEYTDRLKGNYPFFHPRYAGQMLKPPHPVAMAAYAAAMRINPNNHALDGGPPTAEMEKEVVVWLADMFGLPGVALGHLTSSGTIANLEALWVARSLHPDKCIAFSREAHYTHARMSEVVGAHTTTVEADPAGRIDLDAVEGLARSGRLGTLVLTAGTTGLGAVDPIEEAIGLAARYGFRIHVDAAYGGFFTLAARSRTAPLSEQTRRHLQAIHRCDSVVVDPHKHGLQPYGCGCVLFRDPEVGRFYKHDSPYTYFTSSELHLGEISLECSRSGAAAGALWLTLKLLPLQPERGLGPVLEASLHAARSWHERVSRSDVLRPFLQPELDIVAYGRRFSEATSAQIDGSSYRLFETAMQDKDEPVFLSLFRVSSDRLKIAWPDLIVDTEQARLMRSVLMKPEHETYVDSLIDALEAKARRIATT